MSWLEPFVDFAHRRLGSRVRGAYWARGVSDEQIELYQLGHLSGELPDLEYPATFLEWCWEGRRLKDVFVLPLTNVFGSIRGLQFRSVNPDKKGYSDYTPFAGEAVTFGLSQAMPHIWKDEAVWLVEGVFDVFPIQRFRPNVVPTLTNRMSEPMVRLFRRVVNDLWLAFDMDEKGRSAVKKTSWEYRTEFEIHDVRFPRPKTLDGSRRVKDPNELWETWGDRRLGDFIQGLT